MSQAGIASITKAVPSIPTSFVTDNGTAVPAGNVLDVNGGPGVTTFGSGNQILIDVVTTGFTWNIVTSANNTVQIVKENGYICNGVSNVIFLLPPTPSVGDTFKILRNSANFQITQNASQQIRVGSQITTATTGTLTSNNAGDAVEVVYIGSNVFMSSSVIGTLTKT